MREIRALVIGAALLAAAPAMAGITVDYTQDAGGDNLDPLNGMAAAATFEVNGTTLTILLENTSTGAPAGAGLSDSLLVSVGFDLIDGVSIVSGDSAVIGDGSVGIGSWSGLTAGDSVAEEWLWTNDAGGDLLEGWSQIISTSNGQGGGTETLFGGGDPNVSGPHGGIAASPAIIAPNPNQPAVSSSIMFSLTLSDSLDDDQLLAIAMSSLVEFGSDFQYLAPEVPAPGALALLATAGLVTRRRRRA